MLSHGHLVIARAFRVKWLVAILTFGNSQHLRALKGHLVSLIITLALIEVSRKRILFCIVQDPPYTLT